MDISAITALNSVNGTATVSPTSLTGMLLEKDYKISRDVNYYAEKMNISSKYLTNIVNQVTGHPPRPSSTNT
jgi:hypothetical protein